MSGLVTRSLDSVSDDVQQDGGYQRQGRSLIHNPLYQVIRITAYWLRNITFGDPLRVYESTPYLLSTRDI